MCESSRWRTSLSTRPCSTSAALSAGMSVDGPQSWSASPSSVSSRYTPMTRSASSWWRSRGSGAPVTRRILLALSRVSAEAPPHQNRRAAKQEQDEEQYAELPSGGEPGRAGAAGLRPGQRPGEPVRDEDLLQPG